MKSRYQIDHLVIKVADLATAMADYEALGFTVLPGGEHKRFGSRNALIAFRDGSYLELIAYPKDVTIKLLGLMGQSAVVRRAVRRIKRGEGLVDWALLPTAIEEDLALARARGLGIEGPLPASRLRPDGLQVSWQFGIPDHQELPFLCADVTPRAGRVPDGAARQHANGATGIHSITVAVHDLDASVARYRALLGIQEEATAALAESKTGTTGLRAAFTLGSTTIRLAMPLSDPASALHHQLTTRGEGAVAFHLRSNNKNQVGKLALPRSHGWRWQACPEQGPSLRSG
ncbi:MAG: VOC family protein [Ardenticatenaceae bacterium]